MKRLIYFQAPILTRSGYGAHARELALSLLQMPEYDVKFVSTPWGSTPMNGADDPIYDTMRSKIISGQAPQPDIFIQLTIPNEFQPLGKYNIGITAGIETTACTGDWIEGCNRMDRVIVTSKHSADVFKNMVFDKVDKNTNQKIGTIQLTKPIDILFEGCDVNVYRKIDRSEISDGIDKLFDDIPENFVYLCVGQWIQGDIGADRKDLGMLVKTFLETFKNKTKRPALMLKSNGATFSIMDREDILNKIRILREEYGENAPNVYLLHGDLTDIEMNELYNHPKVKAMISFTHGEGFGRPLLEFTMTGKPVIAPNWSGHIDFLSKNFSILLPGQLHQVPSSAVNKWIIPESGWFVVNYPVASNTIREVFLNYKAYHDKAKKQRSYSLSNFTFDKMHEQFKNIIDTCINNVPEQVTLNLPKLKKKNTDGKVETGI